MSEESRSLDWESMEALFEAALARPPTERASFLEHACPDPAVRAELESLLARVSSSELLFDALGASLGIRPLLDERGAGDGGGSWSSEPASASLAADLPDPLLRRTVGHYRIDEKIGIGGMGVVYRARDLRLEREVALKFLSLRVGLEPGAKERFLVEARAAAAIDHPNICTVHELGETEDGRLFIAMTFCEGETLRERIARQRLRVEEAASIARQIARGLAAAHSRAVVHRDVKPGNVMLTPEGGVRILDFGLVQIGKASGDRPGARRGTVAYMSPERLRGAGVDARTDLWSLGVVLYEMLAGSRPFRGKDVPAVVEAILREEPPPIREARPETPERLASTVTRLISKDPSERPATAELLLADLESASPPSPPADRSPSSPSSTETRAGRVRIRPGRRSVPVVGTLAAVAAFAAIALWLSERPAGSPRGQAGTRSGGSRSVAAHELFLRGNDPARLRSDTGARRGLEYFRKAIELDSTYAAAWAGLARMYFRVSFSRGTGRPFSPRQSLARAEHAARRAVSLSDSLAEAHATLGIVLAFAAHDFAAAESELKRAVRLDPAGARQRQWLAQLYLLTGRPDEALPAARSAVERDPLSASAHAELAHALLANGRPDEALVRLRRIGKVVPPPLRVGLYTSEAYALKGMWPEALSALHPLVETGGSRGLALYGYVLARAGRREEALGVRTRLLDRWRRGTAATFDVAVVHAGLGDLDEAYEWLDRAVEDGSVLSMNFHVMEPIFEELRSDPRFERVRERVGIPGR